MAEGADVYAVFLERFENLGLNYFVTGSVASSAYGEPRFTQDLDLVVRLSGTDVDVLLRAFPAEQFYVPPHEALVVEIARHAGGHFNLIHHASGVRADVYVAGDDELEQWALAHRRRIQLSSELGIWLAPPEYIVVRKLEWRAEGGGEHHEHDIQRMLAALGEYLDLEFVRHHVEMRGLIDVWIRVRAQGS